LTITISAVVSATTVAAVSPAQGLPFGGTDVTITGLGFTGATGVSFGGSPATGVTVVNDSTITATSPAGVNYQTVDVRVTAPGGISATSSADQYSYTDWVAAGLPSVPSENLGQVACFSPTRCTATAGANHVYFFNGFTWTVFAGPGLASSSGPAVPTVFDSVSCVSATDCTAVGVIHPTSTTIRPVIDHFNGTIWSQVPSVNPGINSSLSGVSCVSTNFCVAVGNGSGPLVERFNGSAWSQMTAPSPVGGAGILQAVTCISSSECTAVGYYFAGSNIDSLVEHFNGSKWTIVASPNPNAFPTSNELDAVSCTSATNCTAVSVWGFVLHFNGSVWSLLPAPASGRLLSVSCASAADCTGVGTVSPGTSPSATLIEHFDGSAWTPFLAPSPDTFDALESVDCRNATFCVAVGESGPNFTFGGIAGSGPTPPQPLIEMRTALSLAASVAFPTPGQLDTLTATSPVDVASIGSALDIVDTGTGKVVGSCTTGTSCVATVTLSGTTIHTYAAEIATPKGTNVTALSAPLAINTTAFSLALTTSSNAPTAGQAVTLTATATSDVTATGSPLRIVDTTTNHTVGSCSSGVTCSASVLVTAGGVHTYQAVISGKAKVSSAPISVTWQATTLTLVASTTSPGPGQPVTLTATANFNPSVVGLPIKIVDLGTGRTLAQCSASTCIVKVDHFDPVGDSYQATIGGKVQLATTPVVVSWPAVTIGLQATTTSPAPKATVTLTATSPVPLDGTGEALIIVDTTTGNTLVATLVGTTLTANVKFPSGSHTYQAEVRPSGSATIQVSSTPVTITW
jgi:hypothetical protein